MSDVEAKMPEAGEYWESSGGVRIRIVGKGLRECDYVCLYNNGHSIVIEWKITGYNWRHLPGCDSFSWEEPKFPPTESLQEIFQKMPIGFDSYDRYREELKINPALIAELEQQRVDEARAILTKLEAEAEAVALLDKPVAADPIPAATIKEPISYVVQNRATVSEWRDHVRWSTWPAGHWEKATERFTDMMHGCKRGNAVLSVRCKEAELPDLTPMMLHREVKPFEELPSVSDATACVNLRVPLSGDELTDNQIRHAVRRDIAVAFVSGSLAWSPGHLGRADWQDSNQLGDLPGAAVTFADELMKQLGFTK
jgi:hypothetical protein